MDLAFILQVVIALAVGLAALLFVARFSHGGTAGLRRWTFWSLPVGAVIPGLLLVVSIIVDPQGSDHPALAALLILISLGGVFFVSCLVSMFLRRPEGAARRFAVGLAANVLFAVAVWISEL